MPQADLISHCRSQFVRLFGQRAAKPEAEFLKDWAGDPYTATAADDASDSHQAAWLPSTASEQPWKDRLIGIASEWSPNFPGYVAGAVEAASRGVEGLLASSAVSRSEEHPSELQSLMRISYAVFCLKKQKTA